MAPKDHTHSCKTKWDTRSRVHGQTRDAGYNFWWLHDSELRTTAWDNVPNVLGVSVASFPGGDRSGCAEAHAGDGAQDEGGGPESTNALAEMAPPFLQVWAAEVDIARKSGGSTRGYEGVLEQVLAVEVRVSLVERAFDKGTRKLHVGSRARKWTDA